MRLKESKGAAMRKERGTGNGKREKEKGNGGKQVQKLYEWLQRNSGKRPRGLSGGRGASFVGPQAADVLASVDERFPNLFLVNLILYFLWFFYIGRTKIVLSSRRLSRLFLSKNLTAKHWETEHNWIKNYIPKLKELISVSVAFQIIQSRNLCIQQHLNGKQFE